MQTRLDKNQKLPTQITKPLHMYFESELEFMHKHFTETGNKAALALIEPELAQRRRETIRSQGFTKIAA